ncbi:MAG: Lrp/AsnC family transcriptional regulator [Candidatus Lokiarchaeota archaeon]
MDILKELSKDGRISFRGLGDKLSKSPVTIKRHVEILEQEGIIKGYGIQIDYEKLGYDIIALIEITISQGKMIEVEKLIARNPYIFGVYDVTGNYDAVIFARFKSRIDLSKMIKKIHASPFIKRTNTHIILNVIKEGSSFSDLTNYETTEKKDNERLEDEDISLMDEY